MEESRQLEFKREVSRSFLKTASAYANYGTGKIIFGIDDDGSAVGVADPAKVRLAVENALNDSIDPVPRFSLETERRDGAVTVALTVYEGPDKPYLYRGKAYRRSDTADVEVGRAELGRLVLSGNRLAFEELPSRRQDLSFGALARELSEKAGVSLDENVLKTLGLYSEGGGYNNAAAALADENALAGVDIVRFGEDDSVMLDRERLVGVSALEQLAGALSMYRKYYRYEKIEGALRTERALVPEEAFRESVANAIVHRDWSAPSNVQVAMRPGSITVSSPGGLPDRITVGEYLGGHVSVLRNPVLANVFFRLGHIEAFGTGVDRIRDCYQGLASRPSFSVSENLITVVLPVCGEPEALSDDEERALGFFDGGKALSRVQLEGAARMSKAKAGRVLASLVGKGRLVKVGSGRATRYALPDSRGAL